MEQKQNPSVRFFLSLTFNKYFIMYIFQDEKIDTIEVNISGKKLNESVDGWDNNRKLI